MESETPNAPSTFFTASPKSVPSPVDAMVKKSITFVDVLVALFGAEEASIVDTLTGTRLIDTSIPAPTATAPQFMSASNSKVLSPKMKPPRPSSYAAAAATPNTKRSKSPVRSKAPPMPTLPVSDSKSNSNKKAPQPKKTRAAISDDERSPLANPKAANPRSSRKRAATTETSARKKR